MAPRPRRPRHRSRNSPSSSSDPDPLLKFCLLNPGVHIWGGDGKHVLSGAVYEYLVFKQESTAYRNEDGVLIKISPDYKAPGIIITIDIQKDDGDYKDAVAFWREPDNKAFLTDQLAAIIQALGDMSGTERNPRLQVDIKYPADGANVPPGARLTKFTVTCQLQSF
ncbi:uncharacterized protein LOC62_03G005145 [Vanrija pseudolonga]|uniref:Uncharacterized protein n=1 Tax=Vanrija pseudolonga TaxID=143232 RepID=A0AAF0Y821_9TREE|nr:hypothetical protein LOC62_03G005145 [Vanrija pseudolonga]